MPGNCAESIESEMPERGVLPDLLGPLSNVSASSLIPGVRREDVHPASSSQALICWEVKDRRRDGCRRSMHRDRMPS